MIKNWEHIKKDFHDILIIGNGSSIAIDQCFNYKSIYDYAESKNLFDNKTKELFKAFKTQDFELVLKYLLHAQTINSILEIDNKKLTNNYDEIKNNLINIIREVHPEYSDVEEHLKQINKFLQNFKTVISLNYDLMLYWAIMLEREKYIDYFNHGKFDPTMSRENRTEIFYLHGSLILGRDRYGNTIKLKASESQNLLNTIGDSWENQEITPLFVSEGNSKNKLSYIQNNYYLNYIYNNVLLRSHKTMTIYGWSFSEQDEHILKRMLGFRCRYEHVNNKKIAISNFNSNYEYCKRIENKIIKTCNSRFKPIITFFNSQSNGCWNNK